MLFPLSSQPLRSLPLGGGFSAPLTQNDEVLVYYNPLHVQAHPSEQPVPQYLQLKNIHTPHPHDVLMGKGNGTKHHPGNIRYRALVKKYSKDCAMAKKFEKPTYARSVVLETRTLTPPGRFLRKGELEKKENPAWYYDIGNDKAILKASQALRDIARVLRQEAEKETNKKIGKQKSNLEESLKVFIPSPNRMNSITSSFVGLITLDEQGTIGSEVKESGGHMARNADQILGPNGLQGQTIISPDLARKRGDHNAVSILDGDLTWDMQNFDSSLNAEFPSKQEPSYYGNNHRISVLTAPNSQKPFEAVTNFGGAHQSNATIQYPERSNAHLNSQVSRVTNDSDPASKKNGLHNSQIEGNTNGYVSGARAVASSRSDAMQKRLYSSERSFGGRRSSMEEALNRRQSLMSSINSWKVGDEADNDQESVEEEWGKKFNDRTHRIKDSLENSLLMNSSVMSSVFTDRMESLTSSFDQTTLVADSKRDSDLLVPLPETTQTQRSNSTFDELLESMFSNFERRAPKRRRSIREYMDDMSDPHKKTRLSDSSHLYPIGYEILQSPLLGSFQDMISQQNVSSLTHEDGSKNESVSRSSDCSDELRNWISKEIRMSEGRRISELISKEHNFNEEDYTDDQVLSIASAHLNSGYEEDHVYLRETYRPASIPGGITIVTKEGYGLGGE